MKTNYTIPKARSIFTYLLAIILIGFLASCGSTGSLSSFAKRKYMKGRFSDPIEGLSAKSGSTDLRANVIAKHRAMKSEAENRTVASVSPVVVENSAPIAPAETKPVAQNQTKQAIVTKLTHISLLKGSTAISERQPESITSVNQTAGTEDGHHYFGHFLLCILLCLILGLLGFVVPFLWYISGVCFILAIVFLILWLINV